jgi:hypothetical protein
VAGSGDERDRDFSLFVLKQCLRNDLLDQIKLRRLVLLLLKKAQSDIKLFDKFVSLYFVLLSDLKLGLRALYMLR